MEDVRKWCKEPENSGKDHQWIQHIKGGSERNTNGGTDFRPLKQQFENRRFHSNEGVEVAVRDLDTQSLRSPT